MKKLERPTPLILVILGLLAEQPLHAYRMQQLIRSRSKDSLVNVAQRNSLHQGVDRLLKHGLIEESAVERIGNRPARTVYAITEAGSEALAEWLGSMLAVPERSFPSFPAALSLVMVLTPEVVRDRLRERAATLDDQLRAIEAGGEDARRMGLPRLFLIEDEYRAAMLEAERRWVLATVADLDTGELTWSPEWLAAIAAEFEGTPGEPQD